MLTATIDWRAYARTERLYVELNEAEAAAYQQARDHYRLFCSNKGISMSTPQGWQRFIQETCRSREGRAAFLAYQEQRESFRAATDDDASVGTVRTHSSNRTNTPAI